MSIDRLRKEYDTLDASEKEEAIRYILSNVPPGRKLRNIMPGNSTIAPFDLDLIDGQVGEHAFLNVATSGKHEVKRDFLVSETGNIAVEIECRGKPSGIAVTRSPYWVYWLSGQEYQDEVAVIITVERLKRIMETCYLTTGGDDSASVIWLIPIRKLLSNNSAISRFKKKAPQIPMMF